MEFCLFKPPPDPIWYREVNCGALADLATLDLLVWIDECHRTTRPLDNASSDRWIELCMIDEGYAALTT